MRESSLTQLQTEAFTAEREWMAEGIPVLSAAISLPRPIPADSRVTRRIQRYYQLQSRAFLRYCESWLLPVAAAECRAALEASTPLPNFRAELTYQVTYNQGGLWSLYTQSRETGIPGRTLLTRWGDTWDLAAGYPIPLGDFFTGERRWKKRLLSAAAAEIERQERAGIAQYHEGWARKLRHQFNPRHYYLTENGLTFFYPMYAIAPAAEGIPAFTMPYGEAGPHLPRA